MKQLFSVLAVTLCLFTNAVANPSTADLTLNETQLAADLGQLSRLEQYVQANPGATLASVRTDRAELTADLSLETSAINGILAKELPGNIPPFVWGLCLGVVGILLVYILSDNDRDMTMKSFYGCLVGTAVWVVLSLVLNIGIFGFL